ncbi:MAG: hypothetical protein ACHQ3P_00830 [Candidatus Limnocylindrales bacterium]
MAESGFSQFDRLMAVVRRTRELLDAVAIEGTLPEGGADYLAEATLPHIDGVRDGFHGWLRADTAGPAELRYVIAQSGWMRVDDGDSPIDPAARIRPGDPWHLAALSHARLVLAFLPRVPDDAVRFPGPRRTYADIAAPRGPAELAARIDEMERELWRTATGHPDPPSAPAFRRTYGFFDASERLGLRLGGRSA